jgi:hypothetical protein
VVMNVKARADCICYSLGIICTLYLLTTHPFGSITKLPLSYLQYCKPQMGMTPEHWSKGKGQVERKHWIADLYCSPSPEPLSIHLPLLHYYIVFYVRVNMNWFPGSFWTLPTKARA